MKSREELLAPKPAGHRWNAWDKEAICQSVAADVITPAELQAVHGITAEEFASWREKHLAGEYAETIRNFGRKSGRSGRAA